MGKWAKELQKLKETDLENGIFHQRGKSIKSDSEFSTKPYKKCAKAGL